MWVCGKPFVLHLPLLLTLCIGGHAGKILVFPVDGSHWVNMEVLVKELHSRGHQLTVIRQSTSWFVQENSSYYTSITVTLEMPPVGIELFDNAVCRILEGRRKGLIVGLLTQLTELMGLLQPAHETNNCLLAAILDNRALVAQLRNACYDLMLTDPGLLAGALLGHYLQLPLIYNVRWASFGEGHFTIAPSPVSYVPVPGSRLTDRMGFMERTTNLLHFCLNLLLEHWLVLPIYSGLLHRHFPVGTDILAMQYTADLWLMRVDFVFEFPRPTMPNVVYIGGFQCHPAKVLPDELEAFVQGSGESGLIVMSLGSLISSLPTEMTEAIALAFSQLPQRVVWRFVGERPISLGNNTLLMPWIPQNDLLGHTKTRLFVAHGGTNGLYEAIYHGVPVLGLPLLFDQTDNLVRLQARGATRMLDAATFTAKEFLEVLQDTLENPSYRRNMQRLSRLHRDQPIHPLKKAVFWVEYVIRHKGAAHLRTEAYSMPFYSYYSLDVVLFLLSVPVLVLGALCVLFLVLKHRKDTSNETNDSSRTLYIRTSSNTKERSDVLTENTNMMKPTRITLKCKHSVDKNK